MMRIVRYTVIVVTTLTVLLLLWQFGISIVLFLLSLAVAAALRPVISSITGEMFQNGSPWGLFIFC